jgi:hypothetical protein
VLRGRYYCGSTFCGVESGFYFSYVGLVSWRRFGLTSSIAQKVALFL